MSTLSEAIDAYADTGFTEHFAVRSRRLVGLDGGSSFEAHEVVIRGFQRFEGISDPDDMSIVYAIETQTGLRGTRRARTSETSPPALHGGLLNELTALRCHAAGASAAERRHREAP